MSVFDDSGPLDSLNGVMMAPNEMRGDFEDAANNARGQLSLSVAAHVTAANGVQSLNATRALTQLRDALARKYEVFRRVGEVIATPASAHWMMRSQKGLSVRWSAASDAVPLHDVTVVENASESDWKLHTCESMRAGFPLDDRATSAPVLARHSRAPWRLIGLFRADGRSVDLLLTFNHSVADGTSSLRLARDLVAGLECLLAGQDIGQLWTPVPAPPPMANVLFGEQPSLSWTEWFAAQALGAALRLIPKTVLAGDIPGIAIAPPFTTRMIYTEPCSRDDWSRLFAAMKQHGVKLQATMYAVSMFLCGAAVAARRPGVGASKPISFDLMMPIATRDSKRVTPGHRHPSDDAVGVTIGMGSVAAKIDASQTFWQQAKTLQAGLDESIKPSGLRFATSLLLQLLGYLNSTPATGAVIATLDPINLGRGVHACQFEHCSAQSMHMSQKSPEFVTAAFGFVWPFELNGQCSFSMEYCEQLWTEEQANQVLQLFIKMLFDAPTETFGQFAARAANPSNPEHVLTKLK